MSTFPKIDWDLAEKIGEIGKWQKVSLAVLMDIRRELEKLNALLNCQNFIRIPRRLQQIEKNTRKKRRVSNG